MLTAFVDWLESDRKAGRFHEFAHVFPFPVTLSLRAAMLAEGAELLQADATEKVQNIKTFRK